MRTLFEGFESVLLGLLRTYGSDYHLPYDPSTICLLEGLNTLILTLRCWRRTK